MPKRSSAATWLKRTHSLVSEPEPSPTAASVSRNCGSLPSRSAQKNVLWRLRDDASQFLRPHAAASARFVERTVSHPRRLRTGRDFFVQFALPGVIDIDGDEATTRTLCHEAARGPGKTYYRNHCIASDRLRRAGDGWVFASRSFQYLWLDTSPFTGDAFPLLPTVAAA
jgi:hypothetical protein